MAITNYSELQTAVANWLDRSDLTARIPEFIDLAEAQLQDDERVRKLKVNPSFAVASEKTNLPSDFDHIETIYHDGPTYWGPLDNVGIAVLSEMKASIEDVGVPRAYAIIDGQQIWVSPEPDGSFDLVLAYWLDIPKLSGTQTTNWLLTDHPHVYLFATLMEAEPFLKHDERIATWERKLERALMLLDKAIDNEQFSGDLVQRPNRPIG